MYIHTFLQLISKGNGIHIFGQPHILDPKREWSTYVVGFSTQSDSMSDISLTSCFRSLEYMNGRGTTHCHQKYGWCPISCRFIQVWACHFSFVIYVAEFIIQILSSIQHHTLSYHSLSNYLHNVLTCWFLSKISYLARLILPEQSHYFPFKISFYFHIFSKKGKIPAYAS